MSTTVVRCSLPGCKGQALFKIAAHWSDGSVAELKSYGFSCSEHLRVVFGDAERRFFAYSGTPGETLEELGIYKYEQGKRDRHLQRLWGLEENYRS